MNAKEESKQILNEQPKRWHSERFCDAIRFVRNFGKPDVLITVSCNPYMKEIQDSLLPGQNIHDRPDVIGRIFKMKLNALIDDVTVNRLLGKKIAHVHTVEWQKINKICTRSTTGIY